MITHHRIGTNIDGEDFVQRCQAFDKPIATMFVRLTAVTILATDAYANGALVIGFTILDPHLRCQKLEISG
jgi:hypothetical protein